MGFNLSISETDDRQINDNSIRAKPAQETDFFNRNGFTQDTEIKVDRSIISNDWGYVTIIETVTLQNSSTFNAFHYSITTELYDHVQYMKVHINEGGDDQDISTSLENDNTTATWTVSIPEVSDDTTSTYRFQIVLAIANTFTTIRDTLAGVDGYPFRFEGYNFYPWFDFPITELSVTAGIESVDTNQKYDNDTNLPKPSDVNGNFEDFENTTMSLGLYSEITSVPGIAQTTIANLYPNAADREIIPEYHPETAEALTQPVRFDAYFENAPLEYKSVESIIDINQWGSVFHTERITMVHRGVEGQNIGGPIDPKDIPIFINVFGIKTFSAYDAYGNLSDSTKEFRDEFSSPHTPNITLVKVAPRVAVSPGNEFTIEMKYEVRHDYRLYETSGFLTPAGNLTIPAMSIFNWTNTKTSIKVIFPPLASIKLPKTTMWGQPVSNVKRTTTPGLLGFPRPTLEITISDFSYYDNTIETIQYSFTPVIGLFFEPILFMLLFSFLGLLYVLIRNFSFALGQAVTPSTSEVTIPFDLIRGFVINYEEKTALRARVTSLEKKRKNLKKMEFQKQKQTLLNKQVSVDRELVKFTSELSEKGARYRDAVRSIELAEAEREQALSNLTDLETKKKQKRMRAEIYNKLKEDYSRRLRRSNATIERVLVNLRSLLTERR
ncbi:MAG: hypothetical protein ACXAC7_06800 [Candidatus Hodarchaeales archaeon]|jgi:hypothetical protein